MVTRPLLFGIAALATLRFLSEASLTRAADLLDLYARAIEFDPVYQAAVQQRQIGEELLRESLAGRRPALEASADVSKLYQDVKSSESFLYPVMTKNYGSTGYSISLTQPIYRAEAFVRVSQARAEVRQAAALFAAAEQDLVFRVAEAHFYYLAALDNLDSTSAERLANERQLAETEERLGSGLATMTDVHEARARFALAQATELNATDVLEERRQAIVELIGSFPSDLAVLSEAFPLVPPDRPDVDTWVAAALFQNPDLKAREAAIEITREEVRRQRGRRLPGLDLVASYGERNSGGTEIGIGGGTDIVNGQIGLRIGIPIYDGGRASALTRAAILRERIASEDVEREKRRVERETRAAFQGVTSGISRVEALSKSVFSSEAALARKEEGMRSGLSTGLAVLDARRDLFRARRDLTLARYDYILSSLRLKRAAGILGVRDLEQINAYLQ